VYELRRVCLFFYGLEFFSGVLECFSRLFFSTSSSDPRTFFSPFSTWVTFFFEFGVLFECAGVFLSRFFRTYSPFFRPLFTFFQPGFSFLGFGVCLSGVLEFFLGFFYNLFAFFSDLLFTFFQPGFSFLEFGVCLSGVLESFCAAFSSPTSPYYLASTPLFSTSFLFFGTWSLPLEGAGLFSRLFFMTDSPP